MPAINLYFTLSTAFEKVVINKGIYVKVLRKRFRTWYIPNSHLNALVINIKGKM